MYQKGIDCIIPASALIEPSVQLGTRVLIDEQSVVVRKRARIDSGSIIGPNVTIGSGAWILAGSVCLQSVPPNAIVQGNPAKIVGYRSSSSKHTESIARLIDYSSIPKNKPYPISYPLNISDCRLLVMRKIDDPRGTLTVGEVQSELPFIPQRYFVIYGVNPSDFRGEHAHIECKQFLLCLHGSVRVLVDDGIQRCEIILDRPDLGLFMSEMTWGTQYNYSHDCVLLVFASLPYDSSDYIRDYDEFISKVRS